jgi:hypothetical protein
VLGERMGPVKLPFMRPRSEAPRPSTPPDELTLAEAALWMGTTEADAAWQAERGLVPAHREGDGWVFRKSEIAAARRDLEERQRRHLQREGWGPWP